MIDTVDQRTRSTMMSRIRSKNTWPELVLRKHLHAIGLRYRLHAKDIPGRPDLVFPRYHAVVFINGCFWHSHADCRYAAKPTSNMSYWLPKLEGVRSRDERTAIELRSRQWRVAIVWECALRADHERVSVEVATWLRSSVPDGLEIPGPRQARK